MDELIYKRECFEIVGGCLEVHRELGKGYDEIIYKGAIETEFAGRGTRCCRERAYPLIFEGTPLPWKNFADFVVMDRILLEAKAVEQLTNFHVRRAHLDTVLDCQPVRRAAFTPLHHSQARGSIDPTPPTRALKRPEVRAPGTVSRCTHVRQVLSYLAASRPARGRLVNFGGESLTWKRVVLTKTRQPAQEAKYPDFRGNLRNSRPSQ